MGRDLVHRASNRSSDEVAPRAAKISFSKKLKLPVEECGSFHSRNDVQRNEGEMFFARIGGFPDEEVKSVAENWKGIKLNFSLPENLGGGAAIHGKAQKRVSFARKRWGRQLCLARITERFDPETQEKIEEVKEEVEESVEEIKEDVTEAAQQARVPVHSTSLPYIGFVRSLTVKNLLCGVLAGAAASFVVFPFNVLRTRAIAGQGGRTAAEVFSTAMREEGLQSLQGNLTITLIATAMEKGLQFTTFEFVKRNQEEEEGKHKKILPLPKQIPVATAGGAAAGFVGTLLSYPLQPVTDRLLLEPDNYKGVTDALMSILRNEGGVRELYRGVTPALIAIVPSAAVSFYTYETLKTKHFLGSLRRKPGLDAVRSLIIGGLAGLVSTTVTYPLELARKEILLSALPSTAVRFAGAAGSVQYNNTWQALNGIVTTEGFRGLYRGLPAQALQVVPMTAVTFMVYELAKRAFVASGEERRDEVKDVDDLKK